MIRKVKKAKGLLLISNNPLTLLSKYNKCFLVFIKLFTYKRHEVISAYTIFVDYYALIIHATPFVSGVCSEINFKLP